MVFSIDSRIFRQERVISAELEITPPSSHGNRKQIDFMAAATLICARAVRLNVMIINRFADDIHIPPHGCRCTSFISVGTTVLPGLRTNIHLGTRMVIVVPKLPPRRQPRDISFSANAVCLSLTAVNANVAGPARYRF